VEVELHILYPNCRVFIPVSNGTKLFKKLDQIHETYSKK